MKICQVTPGLLPIPPNGWGAIEKIIWEYKKNFEKTGNICDIKYLDDVNPNEYDIIHIHVANLAIEAYKREFKYVFTMHDHHTEFHGGSSFIYNRNKEAIDNSLISFVPARHLLYFFNSHKLHYLRHGVDSSFFIPSDVKFTKHRLLCLGNNGILGDDGFDRKGFIYAIEAARKLNLPLTIAGPEHNKKFFELNKDYKPYDKLSFLYNLNENELLDVYKNHTIFLHPSSFEAGHPNLTLVEAISCGLPVVSCYDSDPFPGMMKIERNVDSVINGISNVISDYSTFKSDARRTAELYDWKYVVNDLIENYKNIDNFRMKNELIDAYDLTMNKNKQSQPIKKPKISLNFSDGAFLSVSNASPSIKYDFTFINDDTNQVLYKGSMKTNEWSKCFIKRYIPYRVELFADGIQILNYKQDLKDKTVLIGLDTKSLGDCIAWFPYVEEFRKKHQCEVICSTNWGELFDKTYPNIKFVPLGWNGNVYAVYNIGCFADKNLSLYDYKEVSLQQLCSSILGLKYEEIKPKLVIKDTDRKLKEKYITFATHSTAQAKFWNNPTGWQEVINYLNSINLKPVLIQAEKTDGFKNIINLSGPKNIQETINYIHNSEFFIGIGSGLSWLAWALNKPVVLISGFSGPQSEFYTPYRVINTNVCNSCWNECAFDKGDWNWCPKQKNTPRQFECSKQISSSMVIKKINQILGI